MSEALQAIERSGRNENGGWFSLPRLRGLFRASRCLGVLPRRVRGRIVSADVNGIVVDLDGVEGIAPRHELGLDWLLAGSAPGRRFSGYVTAIDDKTVMLSRFRRGRRRRRARRRDAALAAMTAQLHEPVEPDVVPGLVLTTGEEGAMVALEDGLITGLVPALALESRPYLTVGRRLYFRVIGQPQEPGRDIDVFLWPQPLAAPV